MALVFAGCPAETPPPEASLTEILAAQGAGQAGLQQDNLEDARVAYARLIELAPGDAAGYAGLGLVALRAGDLETAERNLTDALERDPEDAELRLALARLGLEAGDTDHARALLDESLVRDSAHTRTLWLLAKLEGDDGNGERRALLLGRMLAVDPGNLAALVEQADAQLDLDNADLALAMLETLRQVAPDFSPRQRGPFEAAEDALRAGDTPTARARLAEFRSDFEVTGPYQDGLAVLRPPDGELVGVPQLDFSFLVSLRVQEPEAVLAALHFTDASELAGFEALDLDGGAVGGAPDGSDEPMAAIALGDFDGDGDEDLLWSYRGEGRFLRVDFGRFIDAAGELGPVRVGDAATAIWADIDDDRRLDAWFSGTAPTLFRRDPDRGLIPVPLPATAAEGRANDVFFADLDQDGDLDAFEARTGLNQLFRNNGDGSFSEMATDFGLAGAADADTRAAAFADLDDDRDLDVVVADGAGGIRLLTNARGGRFDDETARLGEAAEADARAVALGDVDGDGAIDIAVAGSNGLRILRGGLAGDFAPHQLLALDGLEPRDLLFVDFDNDGYVDLAVAGRSTDGRGLRLFRNDGTGAFEDADRFLPDVPASVRTVASFDYNEDGDADLVILGADGRPRLLRNDGGNANHYLKLDLVGLGAGSRKNNRFGIGARVEVRAGDLYQVHTVTDPTLLIGLGGRLKADVIRVHWPNGVPQDLYFPGTDQDLIEQQTLKGSCPLLYVWDGDGFEFVGDIMWKSALGMPLGILGGGERAYAPAFPSQEYRRLPDGILQPLDGEYVMQVTEELWETIYVDGVSLVAVDHPAEIDVFVNERFVPPAPTELELWRVGERHLPITAIDGSGHDQRAELAARDFTYVSSFRPGRFQGIAEPHELILDLGQAAASGDVTLFLTGWIFPTDASINVAMGQSSALQSHFPALDVIGPDGEWQNAIADLGFPSGKDKTVIADLRGLFPADDRRVRIRTNLMVYWDEAFFTTGAAHPAAAEVRITSIRSSSGDLHYRGFSREFRKGGRYGPHWFDYDSVSVDARWHDLEGLYTRFGDVTDLVGLGDDRYVIANAGDEITLRFDAAAYPRLSEGWIRTFLIYSDGWVKDGDLNTASGDRAAPPPFRTLKRYPYGTIGSLDVDAARRATFQEFQTRRVSPRRSGGS